MPLRRLALLLGIGALVSTAFPAWADPFVEFFRQQKIGQEIRIQGPFRRGFYKKRFFKKDYKTGQVENYEFFTTVILPTHLVGNGSLTQKPRRLDIVVVFYSNENLVRDLPLEGDHVWFIGTLLGYQHGTEGITTDVGTGGPPYMLLKSVERAE